MPTRADFEVAAATFDSAAQQVGALQAAASGLGATDVLRGGSLGRQVPQRISAAASSAASARGHIETAATTCRDRAAIIGAYEQELLAYDQSYRSYQRASARWSRAYSDWHNDETGYTPHPGDHPRSPRKPTAPPDWADVRRV